ncbi:Catechol 2,3-dioxygenase [Devosia sp. YR412]|uniref:VOC family protein n=1 Tax=Devosia sp. YR412 TaxID=1881030 RepID=UPI0008D7614D|nr:VOC family protein [Devosia sp. YR412]SEQ23912.1 Catechol 2,3-dioxygenase [Devosia sp. YR412]
MLDHIVLTVSAVARSKLFYQKALAPLGIAHGVQFEGPHGHADLTGFGSNRAMYFWLKQGVPHPQAVHFGFAAETVAALQAFYDAALAAGGRDNGAPGPRDQYDPRYHAAYVLDPDGYNVEAVFRDY